MGEELYRQYRSRFHPDDIGPLDELIDRARKHGAGFVYDHRIICRDGTIRYLRIGSVTRDQSGKPVRLSGTCQDVTESVKVKEALDLERTKSLRNAKLASLGEMSAGIAHEINNPLAIIQGTVKVLQQFLGNPEKLATKLATIERATERIAKIVRSLKKFSGTANKSEHRPLDLQGIIKESLTLTDAKIKQYGVDIALNGKVSSPVVCDEIEIEQVFVNLINNAIDAVKDQSNRWIQIEVFENDQSIGARVRDSGPGITVDVQKKLFQPFFTTKPVGQGTGLGLSITKGILNEHHATIELVHSEPNTCFELRFPKLPA
jgi:C4-dicarboxylate-specific signal transduction histidine kinase